MTKYRVTLKRQVWQEAQVYVDARNEIAACTVSADGAIWHDTHIVKNTFEAHAWRSEDVDRRLADGGTQASDLRVRVSEAAEYDEAAKAAQRISDAKEGFDE